MERRASAEPDRSRFDIERRLSGGGFGSVFVVFDRVRGQRVALKRLERQDPMSIYRFKQEFRALADVTHDNLVKLHELFVEPSGWSFTMELVDGVPFDQWVRGHAARRSPSMGQHSTQFDPPRDPEESHSSPIATTAVLPPSEGVAGFDEQRLRIGLRQLALGISALHAEGILHRDLKPTNVLVNTSGRVVILDFGLVATGVVDSHETLDQHISGTPAYMSPEQARGAPVTAASDWYSFGLMIYEVLTGKLPFVGAVSQVLAAKSTNKVSDPRARIDGLPDDLVELCLELLERDPSRRPGGQEVLDRLKAPIPSTRSHRPAPAGSFVGRREELERLRAAFSTTTHGATVVAHVHGASGYGKSTLIRHFLSELTREGRAVVLSGRCYERESVPFKALDELIDSLYQYLGRLQPVEAATLTPRHAGALVRLFPTLARLESMTAFGDKPLPDDAHELRRQAFAALREMVVRLTDARPLVLFVDDAQWGDSDSAALLRDLLAPPDVPPLLLIVGYRGDAPDENELLTMLRSPRAADSSWEAVDVPLGPLSEEDAAALAKQLLGATPEADELAGAISKESGGSPLFVAELARRVGAGEAQGVSVQSLVGERVARLPEATRRVLELMACSERPLREVELEAACQLGLDVTMTALDRLREEHLVNVLLHADGTAAFEVLHDKMRASVVDGLTPERVAECHARLAQTLEGSDVDPETLAYHFARAGDRERALHFTEVAAERAAEGVAFDHVVELHELALTFASPESRGEICEKLAAALARAGRGEEAARAYLEVSSSQSGEGAQRMRQAAAEQYLRAGLVEEALDAFGPLLAEAGLALPRTPGDALASLLWRRIALKWRGLEFEEREPDAIDPDAARAIDFCWSVGTGLAGIDLVRSARYYVISLQMSLKHGDPYRVARSLSIEAIMKALESTKGVGIATGLAERAHEIAKRLDNPHALGWATSAKAVVAWGNTDLPECRRLSEAAIAHLRQRSLETFREIGSIEVWFALNSTFLMGDLKTLGKRAPECAREAQERGDRYTHSTVRGYILPYLWASRDRVDLARREADAAISVWGEAKWYHQHWAWLRAMCFLDLYEGKGNLVWRRTSRHRGSMKRAMQLRVRTLRSELQYLEGRGALELMVLGDRDRRHRRLVTDRIARLEAENNRLSNAYAAALRAGLVALDEGAEAAAHAFANAKAIFVELGMPMHADAADLRRGECLVEGNRQKGRRLIEGALQSLKERGVAHPSRFAQMLLPRLSTTLPT